MLSLLCWLRKLDISEPPHMLTLPLIQHRLVISLTLHNLCLGLRPLYLFVLGFAFTLVLLQLLVVSFTLSDDVSPFAPSLPQLANQLIFPPVPFLGLLPFFGGELECPNLMSCRHCALNDIPTAASMALAHIPVGSLTCDPAAVAVV